MLVLRVAASLLCGLPLGACSSLPSLPEDRAGVFRPSVKVSDIVEHVKCELADGLKEAYIVPSHGKPVKLASQQTWWRDWVAKIDLSLKVDEAGGITPTYALLHDYPAPAKATPNMFSLGLGAGYTDTASRTATLSFSLPLNDAFSENFCHKRPIGSNLNGDLGIRDWIVKAVVGMRGGGLTSEILQSQIGAAQEQLNKDDLQLQTAKTNAAVAAAGLVKAIADWKTARQNAKASPNDADLSLAFRQARTNLNEATKQARDAVAARQVADKAVEDLQKARRCKSRTL